MKGTPPGERDYHVSLALDDKTMLVFGGANDSDNWRHYNDIFLFDLVSATWSSPKPNGSPPSVRWGHAAVLHNGTKMFTFGGTSEDKFYNDFWQLALLKESDFPAKPPRSTGSISTNPLPSVPLSKKESTIGSSQPLEPPTPIPPKRTAYTTPTSIPSSRVTVPPGAAGKVSACGCGS